MNRRLISLIVCLGVAGIISKASGQQNAPLEVPVIHEVDSVLPTGSFPFPSISLSGKEYFLLEKEKYSSFLTGLNEDAGAPGGSPGGEKAGSAAGPSTGAGGPSAAEAVDPSQPLPQIQFQNLFVPNTYNAQGYANRFILQPVIPIHLNSELFPFHIIRATLPLIGGPDPVQGGVGDLLAVDVFVHPIEDIKSSLGAGYVMIAPTSTSRDVGLGEWHLGPAVFAITRAVPKWVIGGLVQVPLSLESDAYEVQMQPIVNRMFEQNWYVGWGDTVLTLNDQNGGYNVPLQMRVGKVVTLGKQPVNIFLQGQYTPVGFQSGGREEWGIKLSITPLLAGMKLGPLLGCNHE